MTKTVEHYTDLATSAFNAGFATKAAQKKAMDALSKASDIVKEEVQEALRQIDRDERSDDWNDLYYSFPILANWNEKKASAYAAYPQAVMILNDLAELRQAIKSAEINPIAKAGAEIEAKAEAVRSEIIREMESRKVDIVEGLRLVNIFEGMPVTVNAHYVRMNNGTRYVRYFFYLAGKLTALNTLICIAQERKNAK